MKVGIIGAGIVGGAIEHWFADAHELFIHDPVRGTTLADVTNHVDMAYIAVPTPMAEDGSCNLSIVESVLNDLPDGFTAVIKSTVVPGTTQRYHEEYPNLKIAYSPEFLVERRHLEDFGNQDILVCGTHHADVAERVVVRERGGVGRGVAMGAGVASARLVRAAPPGARRVREVSSRAAGQFGAEPGARATVRVDGGDVRVRIPAGSAERRRPKGQARGGGAGAGRSKGRLTPDDGLN